MSSQPEIVDDRFVPEPTDERDIAAEHRRAQASGEVFEGRRYGGR